MARVRLIHAKIPIGLAHAFEERVQLGLYRDTSDAVQVALRKTFAEEARSFLRNFSKAAGLRKHDLLKTWSQVRG